MHHLITGNNLIILIQILLILPVTSINKMLNRILYITGLSPDYPWIIRGLPTYIPTVITVFNLLFQITSHLVDMDPRGIKTTSQSIDNMTTHR